MTLPSQTDNSGKYLLTHLSCLLYSWSGLFSRIQTHYIASSTPSPEHRLDAYQLSNSNNTIMGLDMYLTRRVYIGAEYEHRKVTGTIDIAIDGKPVNIDFKKVSYIIENVGYWRKANQIHHWFVENVQEGEDDCKEYCVSQEQLKELYALCKEVKEKCYLVPGVLHTGTQYSNGQTKELSEMGKVIGNPEIAEELLPTSSGFFFGGTDYTEYYMQDIEETIAILEPLLEDTESEIYYSSSW